MEHICVRCTRLGLSARNARQSLARAGNARTFSTSRTLSAANDSGGDQPPRRSGAFRATTDGFRKIDLKQFDDDSQQPRSQQAPFRVGAHPPFEPPASTVRNPSQTQTQSQSRSQSSTGPPGILRRTGSGTGRLKTPGVFQQGGGAAAVGRPFGRGRGGGGMGRGRGGGRVQRGDARVNRARARASDEQAELDDDDMLDLGEQVEAYVRDNVDFPVNPTEESDHVPGKNMSLEELRKDWPNTPLTATGLAESVQQRIEFLAHRLPHDYQTPMQLVERYRKGKLTRFESEEEKETVIKLATELAQHKANDLMDKKGTDVQAKDMSFSDIAGRTNERQGLTEAYVKGVYPVPPKQKMSFMDDIAKALNNNETYNTLQSEEFLKYIEAAVDAHQGHAQQKRA